MLKTELLIIRSVINLTNSCYQYSSNVSIINNNIFITDNLLYLLLLSNIFLLYIQYLKLYLKIIL